MTLLSDMTSLNEPVYLGDGLYAQFDGWHIELYAWNGLGKTNRVFLEPAVLATFERYLENLRAMIAKAQV
jgi:hypothetical protein